MDEAGRRAGRHDHMPWIASYPEGVDWPMEPLVRPIDGLLDDAVQRWPERPFIEFLGKSWTYAAIGRIVDRAARGFRALGVGPGTRIGLLLPNCPYYPICFFAALRAGGTVVNLSPLSPPEEIERQVADSGTSVVVTLDLEALFSKVGDLVERGTVDRIVVGRMADVLPFPKSMLFPLLKAAELARVPTCPEIVGFHDLVRLDASFEPQPADPRDVAVLQGTGGTTGTPKFAEHTHVSLMTGAAQLERWDRLADPEGERILGVLPLFHVFALSVVLLYGTRIGAELNLLPRLEMSRLLKTVERRRPTLMPGVPSLYAAINAQPGIDGRDLSSLRLCISGGAPLPVEVKERFEELTGCTLLEGYGLTECPVVSCNPVGADARPGSVGLPLPGTVVEIRSVEEPETRLDPGEVGEICVRAPQTMARYRPGSGPAEETLAGGLLRTGDLGRLGEDGYLHVVDRLKDVIITSGFNVWPRKVEEALHQHPDVVEAAVVGVEDDRRGQLVKAVLVRRPGSALDVPLLRDFLQDRLSPVEMPRLIEFRDALPKSPIGKILKRELVDPVERGHGDHVASEGAAA